MFILIYSPLLKKIAVSVKRAFYILLLTFSAQTGFAQSIVKDICIGSGNSNPTNFVRMGNLTYFIANDGLHGYELWVTDGTEAGTTMVRDIDPGPSDACYYHGHLSFRASTLQALGNKVYFFASDESHGFELWCSDGTDLGTRLIKDIMPGQISSSVDLVLVKAGNYLYFDANDGKHGTELWKSDGTDTGTVMVKDIFAGPQHGNPVYLFADNDIVYFAANDNIHGYGLWKSNGTEDGTVFIKNVAPTGDAGDSIPYVKFKGEIYFSGYSLDNGSELWKTNGTTEGTTLVKDINPGRADALPLHFCVFKDHLIFSATTKTNGKELWQSDGTEQGTALIKDIRTGKDGSDPGAPVVLGDKFYFTASDSAQRAELWVSDLSDTGTHIFVPNTSGLQHFKILYADTGFIYFSTDSGGTGMELWRTDGTPEGTFMLREICQGTCSSEPGNFYKSDTTLFFSANDDARGRELWSIGSNVTFIAQITSEKFRDVYIDPLRNKLNQIRQTGSDIVYIKIFDLGGNELYKQFVKDPNQISSDSFKPGIYILRAYDKNDEAVSFVRFVKE
jgi:ELWxxDGT repeat protein